MRLTPSHKALFDELCTGALCLTSNAHLANTLASQYHSHAIGDFSHCYEKLTISALTNWLEANFDKYLSARSLLLNNSQEKSLWQVIISGKATHYQQEHVEQCRNAWQLMQQWQKPLDTLAEYPDQQTQYFYTIANDFQQTCWQHQWTDRAAAVNMLIDHIDQIPLPKHIIFYHFDTLTPQIQALIAALKPHCKVSMLQPPQKTHSAHRITASDAATEMTQFANWAKRNLSRSPNSRIGCIVPDLIQCHTELDSVLHDTFGSDSSYHINTNRQLSDYPMIQAALKYLLSSQPWTRIQHWEQLLHSPFIGQRNLSQHYQTLCQSGEIKIGFTQHLQLLSQNDNPLLPGLQRLHSISQQTPQYPSLWADDFTIALSSIGWPGTRPLTPEERQLIEKWHSLLDSLASLDLLQQTWDFTTAYRHLVTLAEHTPFQSAHQQAQIECLGPLESGGQQFDALWVMHMSDHHWPRIAQPNPFIPKQLQKAWQMPHCDEQHERAFCQQLTQRFLSSANQIIVSHPAIWQDQPSQVSALVAHLPELSEPEQPSATPSTLTSSLNAHQHLTTAYPTEPPWPYQTDQDRPLTSQTLQQQAQCNFKAFASHRLEAKQDNPPHLGLDASEHGMMLHEVLELLWHDLKTHDALVAMNEHQQQALISKHVTHIIRRWQRRKPYTLHAQYAQLEQQKLHRRVEKWLVIEAQRAPFTVTTTESSQTLTNWSIPINVRIDRIDDIDGNTVVIDYKTGQVQLASWFTEPLLAPQLPLYAASQTSCPAGICYAQIHGRQQRFIGITNQSISINGCSDIGSVAFTNNDWQQQCQAWQQQVDTLVNQYAAGNTTLNPYDTTLSCAQCHLQSLCRRQEVEA